MLYVIDPPSPELTVKGNMISNPSLSETSSYKFYVNFKIVQSIYRIIKGASALENTSTKSFFFSRIVNLELDTVSERSEIEDEDGGDGADQVLNCS